MHFVYLINKITFKEKSEKFYTEKFIFISVDFISVSNETWRVDTIYLYVRFMQFITLIMNLIMNLFTFLLFMIVKERWGVGAVTFALTSEILWWE